MWYVYACAEHRKKKLASLDRIVADMRQQKEQFQDQQTTTPEITLDYQHHPSQHGHRDNVFPSGQRSSWGPPPVIGEAVHREPARPSNEPLGMALPKFSFDNDSDLDSPNRYMYVHTALYSVVESSLLFYRICTVMGI